MSFHVVFMVGDYCVDRNFLLSVVGDSQNFGVLGEIWYFSPLVPNLIA